MPVTSKISVFVKSAYKTYFSSPIVSSENNISLARSSVYAISPMISISPFSSLSKQFDQSHFTYSNFQPVYPAKACINS
jgi:hypothetical protein